MGVAYRLSPHGVTFAKPVRLTYRYTAVDLAGSAPQRLRVAYQDADRRWRMFRQPLIDTVARTVSIETTHFSDWSLIASVQLLPGSAKIRVGESLTLRVQDCELPEVPGTDLAPLVYECRDGGSALMTGEWYVNGEDTHDTDGTITPSSTGYGRARYTAPESLPRANPVAVSVGYFNFSRARELLISQIEVVRESTTSHFTFQSSARYNLSWGEGSERVTGDANASQKIETEWPGPFMFGSLAWNTSASHPDGGRWTSLRGTYNPDDRFITAELRGTVTGCEQVWKLDPLQWGQQILPQIASIAAPDLRNVGNCSLDYVIHWVIRLPD